LDQADRTRTRTIPLNYSGTRATVKVIINLIRRGAADPVVIAQRDALVRGLRERDQGAEARAIYEFARKAVRYTEDPPTVDTIKSARFVIENFNRGMRTAADCATQTVLIGTLARSLNIPVRIRIIGDQPRAFYHVHPELFYGGRWNALDVTAETALQPSIKRRARLGYKHKAQAARYFVI